MARGRAKGSPSPGGRWCSLSEDREGPSPGRVRGGQPRGHQAGLVWEVWHSPVEPHRGRDQVARQSGQQSCCTVSSRAHVPGSHLLRAATLTYPGAGQARASSPPTGVRSQKGPPRWPCSLSPGSTLTVAKAPAEGGGKPTERARPDPHPAAGAGPRATRWCGTSVPQAPRKRKP